MNYIRIIVWIFCLGLFIIPKQNIYAAPSSNTETKCCSNSTKEDGCCTKKSNHHDNRKSDHNSCQDGCCNNCNSCHSASNIAIEKYTNDILPLAPKFHYKNRNYIYSTPHISTLFVDIWQPPKISI